MLSICDLILQRQMPGGLEGRATVPALEREALILHQIYERFVANFYRLHLNDWEVSAQKRLDWHAKGRNEHLPLMIPDLVLQEKSSGRILLVDTKFTAQSLIENQWGKPIFDSSSLVSIIRVFEVTGTHLGIPSPCDWHPALPRYSREAF